MNDSNNVSDKLTGTADRFWDNFGEHLPKVLTAIVLVVVALIVAKIAQSIVTKLLNAVGLNKLAQNEKLTKSLKAKPPHVDFAAIGGRIVYWIVLVVFALTIADVLDLTAMRDVIRELLAYLPNVIAAILVLAITFAGARLLRDVIAAALARTGAEFGDMMASVAFYVVLVFGSLMALDQLGFNTTILTANVTIIVGGIMLAFALAFGLGGRDVAGEIVEKAYKNSHKTHHKKK